MATDLIYFQAQVWGNLRWASPGSTLVWLGALVASFDGILEDGSQPLSLLFRVLTVVGMNILQLFGDSCGTGCELACVVSYKCFVIGL